ncbi:copia-like retrotransposable element protein [Lasius niger]|uniref:Copia-like retrotransposable element protein n=1 Tax=Lasius niger TaxID=67767 RepID=A0A0J7JY29_LASNI|nr:copia-like retrotransposable element protein [Lasius niger]
MAIYIDDRILIEKDPQEMEKLLSELKKDFEVTAEENPTTFLGIKFNKIKLSIKLTQEIYARQIVETYGMQNSKSTDTPITSDRETTKILRG